MKRKSDLDMEMTESKRCDLDEKRLLNSFQELRKSLSHDFPKFKVTKFLDTIQDECQSQVEDNDCSQPITFDELKIIHSPKLKNDAQFCIQKMSNLSNDEFEAITGLQNIDSFWLLFKLLDCDNMCPGMMYVHFDGVGETNVSRSSLYGKRGLVRTVLFEDELLLLLLKLRLNLKDEDLALRFSLSTVIVKSLVYTWISFIHNCLLVKKKLPQWPPRNKVDAQMPKQFREDVEMRYLRALLLEVEILGEKDPRSVYEMEPFTFSVLQTSTVWSVYVGITPNGAANLISPLSQGSAKQSLPKVVLELIHSKLTKDDIIVGPQITTDVIKTYEKLDVDYIVCPKSVRTREMMLIRQLATKYLKRLMAFKCLSCLPYELHSVAEKVVSVTVLLTNFNTPLLERD